MPKAYNTGGLGFELELKTKFDSVKNGNFWHFFKNYLFFKKNLIWNEVGKHKFWVYFYTRENSS